MARVTHIDSGVYYNLDCGHVLTDFDVEWVLKKGAKVDCQVCTDTEKRVKAARVEALEGAQHAINQEKHYELIVDRLGGMVVFEGDIEAAINDVKYELIKASQ